MAEALQHLRGLGYRGINVTVPHKGEALACSKAPDEFSVRVGAANTLDLREGRATNTDGPGLIDTLKAEGLNGGRALVLGAGGTARAAVASLSEAGYEITVFNRTPARAEQMLAELSVSAELCDRPDPHGFALVLNTTSASLTGERLPLDWARACPDALAYDLAYGQSPFLEDASAAGLRTLDGLALLVAQGARSFKWWLGIEPDREAMKQAIQ